MNTRADDTEAEVAETRTDHPKVFPKPSVDEVEEASRDSFPASDPPGWINHWSRTTPLRGPSIPRGRSIPVASIEKEGSGPGEFQNR